MRARHILTVLLAASACRASAPAAEPATPSPDPAPATPMPTPTTEPARPAPAAPAPRSDAVAIRFMQRMVGHHAQALTMAALARERSERADMKLLAERIEVAQRDEITSMRRWLRSKRAAVPDPEHAPHAGTHEAMPGMATTEQLEELATSSGRRFDRRFLDLMIRHHEGALVMVAELMGTPGASDESAVFQLASDIDADQRAEIRRMRALRTQLEQP